MKPPPRNFLDVDDLSCTELERVLELAALPPAELGPVMAGRGAALLFEKPSVRTRASAELAVHELGGHPVYLQGPEVGIDERESAEDIARCLAGYTAVVCARVPDKQVLARMASAIAGIGAPVPVVNLLTEDAHPCQALADVLTLRQCIGPLEGRTLAFVGEANNVWRSLTQAASMVGMRVRIAAPDGFGPDADDAERVAALGGELEVTTDPAEAVAGADAVYTDVWTSMGHEAEAESRRRAFAGYVVDDALLAHAAPGAPVLHCLPAHRGEEITAEVLEGPRSVVWRQAANRLDAMRGLLAWLVGGSP